MGIDDAGGLRATTVVIAACTTSRSVSSNHRGTSGPPKLMLPMGRGWLRSPNHPAPETNSAPARPTASGLHTRWAASSAGMSSDSALTANGRTRSPVACRPDRASWADRLCPAAAAGGGGVGDGHQADGAAAGRRQVGDGTRPPGVGLDLVHDRIVLVEHALPAGGRIGRGGPARQGDHHGVERVEAGQRSRGRRSPGTSRPAPGAHRTARPPPRAGRRRLRTTGRRRPEGSSAGGSSNADPKRALLPPPLTWFASAGARAMRGRGLAAGGPARARRRFAPPRSAGARRSPRLRSRRGRAPARGTTRRCRSPGVRRAGRGRSGAGIEPSDSPPVAEPPVGCVRPSAAATMRVAAIGEMALMTTPSGACRPSCQVSEATARLAQP